jgi:hypothetical protein
MIKRIDEITISDFDRIESTGKVNHLVKGFIPVYFYRKRILKLITKIQELLQGNKINDEENTFYKLKSLLKIQTLESSYFIIINQLFNNIPINQIARDIKLKKKLKNIKDDNLKKALQETEILTGIKIEGDIYKSLKALQDEIIFLKDKYNENFKEQPKQQGEKLTLLDFASTYILYTGGSFVGLSKMTIQELVSLKKRADEKYKAETEQYNKMKNGRN